MNYGTGLFGEINKLRYKNKLPLLKWDDMLAEAARNHSKFMAKTGKFEHSKFGDFGFVGADGSWRGAWNVGNEEYGLRAGDYVIENICMNSGGYNIKEVMRSWQKSHGHLENLLDSKISEGGTGVSSNKGKTYITFIGFKPGVDD